MSAALSEPASLAGTVLDGRYRIEEMLGAGGMGVVFRARHVHLQKVVAIKVMRGRHDAAMQQRFLREAQAASMISHSSIVGITDFGMDAEGQPYLVMEYLDGQTLGKVLKEGPLPPERACRIAIQIAQGLQAVHEQGIVHRDLKPDNIFLLNQKGRVDQVKIVDFGIAQVASAQSLTESGALVGSMHYISPEQINGGRVDAATDQYSLGCILYQMLTGELPFQTAELTTLLYHHAHTPPVAPRVRRQELEIGDGLEAAVLRALAKRPQDRFASMTALAEELERLSRTLAAPHQEGAMKDSPVVVPNEPRPRRALAVLGIAVLFLFGVLGGSLWKRGLRGSAAPDGFLASRAALDATVRQVAALPPDQGSREKIAPASLAAVAAAQPALEPDPAPPVAPAVTLAPEPERVPEQKAPESRIEKRPVALPLKVRLVITQPVRAAVAVSCEKAQALTCRGECLLGIPERGRCKLHLFGFQDQVLTYGQFRGMKPTRDGTITARIALLPETL
jgi:predicted Ser/Thr protein kinase